VEFSFYRLEEIPMKTSRCTDSQIMAVLKEAQAGVKVTVRPSQRREMA